MSACEFVGNAMIIFIPICSVPPPPITPSRKSALRHLNRTLSGAQGERADFLLRLAPILRAQVEKEGLAELYEKIDLPLAPVLARMEAAGVRVDHKELDKYFRRTHERNRQAGKSKSTSLAGFSFNINSPHQLAEVLFDKLKLQPPKPNPRQSPLDRRRSP